MSSGVSLGGDMNTVTCHYGGATSGGPICGRPPVWHLSWYDESLRAHDWENSLSCQAHREAAEALGWQIGWRHRVLPVCTLPGSLLVIADEGDDEDGMPVSYCVHPLDEAAAVAEATELISASRHLVAAAEQRLGLDRP